jgi:hypothetical protein
MTRGNLIAVVVILTFVVGTVGCAMLVRSGGEPKVHATQLILKQSEADLARARGQHGAWPHTLTPSQLDGWGNAIELRVPGDDGHPYALVSYGADGQPGGRGHDADITNWEF